MANPQFKIHTEIAFWVNRPPEPAEAPYDRDSIRPCVAACSAAMEIVDNRYGEVREAPFGLMIADDFFHSAAIVGSPVAAWQDLDLSALAGATLVNGQEAGTGTGANVLGVFREHQMSADSAFLRRLWPKVKKAVEFMIGRDGKPRATPR